MTRYTKYILFFVTFTINGYAQINLLKDSITIKGVKYETFDWLDVGKCLNSFPQLANYIATYRANPQFRNNLKIINDSLFFSGTNIIAKKGGQSDSNLNNKIYLNCIADTIRINIGEVIRECYNCRSITSQERVLIINNGILVSDSLYKNILNDSSKLSRKNEIDVQENFLNYIGKRIEWNKVEKFERKQQPVLLRLTISIDENGTSKVFSSASIASEAEIYISELVKQMPKWEQRFHYGKPIGEVFTLVLKLNSELHKISGTIKYENMDN